MTTPAPSTAKKTIPNKSLQRKQAARIAAVQAFYAAHFNPKEQTLESWAEQILVQHAEASAADDAETSLREQPERALLLTLLESATLHEARIAELIETHMADGWKPERMGALLSAIVRVAIAELIAKAEKQPSMIISEYVTLTEAYAEEGDIAFVNGILARVAEKLRNT